MKVSFIQSLMKITLTK